MTAAEFDRLIEKNATWVTWTLNKDGSVAAGHKVKSATFTRAGLLRLIQVLTDTPLAKL